MNDIESPRPIPSSSAPLHRKFQPSLHRIPSPGRPHDRPPRYEPFVLRFWIVSAVCLFTISLGIALQAALHISKTQNGFAVPSKNVFSFVSTQFLTSFFPTLLIVPFAYFWTVMDWMLRWYQPYITLSEGKAPAQRSILLDYVALNRLTVVYHSLVHKHHLVVISTLIALSTIFLQPLVSSVLQVQQVPHTTDATALLTATIGLSPAIDDLNVFFASTGFALASVYNNLTDPPFVRNDWTAVPFYTPPNSYLNGTLAVNTTAIQTEVNCVGPSSLNVTDSSGSYAASATFPNGCSATNLFSPDNGSEQYFVVNASTCASPGLDIVFQPVVFWFYLNSSGAQVASVYCNPTMTLSEVQTSMNLSSGGLNPCTIINPANGTNNVTGSPLNGRPYNGVVFNQSSNAYIASRASAINFGIPDAIYRYAIQQPGGPLSVFQNQSGFVDATTTIYTQHLAFSALNNYFLTSNTTTAAQLTCDIPRLFVDALPAYVLSPLLIIIGLVGFAVHYLHRQARRRLWLTSPPGSIAAIVSMTARSGFGELLLPYDDQRRMEDNLSGLSFRLDRRTGAIIAEEDLGAAEGADGVALLAPKRPYRGPTFMVDGDVETPFKDFKDSN